MSGSELTEHRHAMRKAGLRKLTKLSKPVDVDLLGNESPNDWLDQVCMRWFRA